MISVLCMGLAAGMDLKCASVISNFAAGIVVAELGTSTVTVAELQEAVSSRFHTPGTSPQAGRETAA